MAAMKQDEGWTHEGWMTFCPILGKVDRDMWVIAPRWAVLLPVFWLAERVQAVSMWVLEAVDAGYEPRWMFRLRPISRRLR